MKYIVKKGEYLNKIISETNKKYKNNTITLKQVIEWNKGKYPSIEKNPNLIYPGWELYLGVDGGSDTRKNGTSGHNHAVFNATGTVIAPISVPIYKDCSQSSEKMGSLSKGDKVTIIKKCEEVSGKEMYYIMISAGSYGWFPKAAVQLDTAVSKEDAEKPPEYGIASATDESYIESLKNNMYGIGVTTNVSFRDLLINDNVGIHGMPYQFMDDVDNRFDEEIKFGRTYIDRIVTKMPLLLLTPGRANYMPAYSDDDKNTVLAALMQKAGGTDDDKSIASNLASLLTGKENHRYYTFEFQYKEYYYYVNKMLRYCAVCLGIQEIEYAAHGENSKHKLGSYSWDYAVNEKLKGFLSAKEFVAFYADAVTSISEDISSNTTSSQLGDTFNGMSSLAKEVQFLAGPVAGADFIAKNIGNEQAFNESVSEIWSGLDKTFNSSFFERLSTGFKTVAHGGRLLFPEIWDDSEFSKSYNIDFKLRTPDGDKLSWYYNICVPLIHLLALAAPREMGVNGYMSPFLCRAYYKGLFNIDMGLITNMSISKGKEAAWTIDGLPTEVDVSITIKELYQTLSISGGSAYIQADEPYKFFRNTALVDYLSTTCGISVNKPEIERLVESYTLWFHNSFTDSFQGIWKGLEQSAINYVSNLYSIVTFNR